MKFVKTPPKKDGQRFYSFYLPVMLKSNPLLLFAHLVCGLTEIYGTYRIFLDYTKNPIISVTIGIFTGIVIQGVLSGYLPTLTAATLLKKFSKSREDKIMFLFSLFAVISVILLSAILSFTGSVRGVNAYKEPPKLEIADSSILERIKDIEKQYKIDSINTENEKKNALSVLQNKLNAVNYRYDAKAKQTKNKEINTNQLFASELQRIEQDRQSEISVINDSIYSVNNRLSITKITSEKNKKIDEINQKFDLHLGKVNNLNETKLKNAENEANSSGFNLGFLTIACMLLIIAGYFIKSNFEIGSGIVKTAQPKQYDFDQSILSRWKGAINDRLINWLSVKVTSFEAKSHKYIQTGKPMPIWQQSGEQFTPIFEYEPDLNSNDERRESDRKCRYCERPIAAEYRKDKRYCSDNCRLEAYFHKHGRYPKNMKR